ncbi:MAG: HD domain-containing protein [Rhodocyclaceae bacterium]|nr:HD domain-containing protein [Rhodocyclaceae bacterium]
MRCCWIGTHVGMRLGLGPEALWELYYTLLLKDLGCSSNAARICELYRTDDRHFKRDFKQVDGSPSQVLRFVFGHTGVGAPLKARLGAVLGILADGDRIAQELIQTRCQRGADIARSLRFGERVAEGIHALDEHWDGGGRPDGLKGRGIPLYARIALLAQVIDVFHTADGRDAALSEVRHRAGSWFDPELVRIVESLAHEEAFWRRLSADDLDDHVVALEPESRDVALDEDYLDAIAEAFGQVVDAKSPYTAGHSTRVAHYTERLAMELGVSPTRRRWLWRAALLHDVGKLGVSNAILDKPGRLDPDEWEAVKRHAALSEEILRRIPALEALAATAAGHHERLDGGGYPRGLSGADISLETRIITTADIFDAITAERPYRGAIPVGRTLEIMAESVGTAIDARCFEALKAALRDEGTAAAGNPALDAAAAAR